MPSIREIPPLYRGDSLPKTVFDQRDPKHKGRTWAEFYKTDGLLAKINDGGAGWMESKSRPWLVAAHIGYEKAKEGEKATDEQFAAYHSPLISFSTRPASAFAYMDRSGRSEFEECTIGEATHFIWKLVGVQAVEISPGEYHFTYKASTKNIKALLNAEGPQPFSVGALATQIVHGNIDQDTALHVAALIDTERYLANAPANGVATEVLEKAKAFTKRDSEWLLYPMDPMPGGRGFSARFTLNDHLDLHSWVKKRSK